MTIKEFNKVLYPESQTHFLKHCKLVIDAQNYFYSMYEQSRLPYEAGCESDRFANYLKDELGKFNKANVECYFVFKGASTDSKKRLEKKVQKYEKIPSPVFKKSICKQVLDEMGFDYVTCEFESKQQCAALADKLGCPTMSNDIEFAMKSNSYVNYTTLKFDSARNAIQCKLLRFNNFLKKHRLSRKKFAIFVLLTDENIFPSGYFSNLEQKLKLQSNLPTKYLDLFKWLSITQQQEAVAKILQDFDNDDRKEILQKLEYANSILTEQVPGIPCYYFLEKNKINVQEMDNQWFEKGVACRYISIPYIYLYHNNYIEGCWDFEDTSKPDAVLLSIDIIKYGLNLLTNFTKDSFHILSFKEEMKKIDTNILDVPKPNYPHDKVVFQNGWTNIAQYKLFEHFLKNAIKDVDWEILLEIPGDARLMVIALIYVAHKSETWGLYEAFSVIASYAVLHNSNADNSNYCFGNSNTLARHFSAFNISNNDILHSLYQFQHCLNQMNHLNALCGFPFKPTIYSKTYNGTFVYNILTELKHVEKDAFMQLTNLFQSQPTVISCLKDITNTYNKIMSTKNI